MAEKRIITLLNTETHNESEIEVEVKSLSEHNLRNTDADQHDAAAVEAAADKGREWYEKEHGGNYLVVGIRRGRHE